MVELIDSYYIDDNNVMHTYIGDAEHVTISDVINEEQANRLIQELNDEIAANSENKN